MKRMNWTVDEYHEQPAISSGGLRTFRVDGPLEYHRKYVLREDDGEEKDWQRLGTAFHLAMEDLDEFRESYHVVPDIVPDDFQGGPQTDAEQRAWAATTQYLPDGSTGMTLSSKFKRHKAFLAEQQLIAESNGKSWLTKSEAEAKEAQVQAVWDNPAARPFLGDHTLGNREVPFWSEDQETGLPMKALADIVVGDAVVDFKTTRYRNPDDFVRDCIGYPVIRDGELKYWKAGKGYAHQLAHYLYVTGLHRAIIITVCTDPPFESMVYEISPDILKLAHGMNLRTMRQIATCMEYDAWHTLGWGEVVTVGQQNGESWE